MLKLFTVQSNMYKMLGEHGGVEGISSASANCGKLPRDVIFSMEFNKLVLIKQRINNKS